MAQFIYRHRRGTTEKWQAATSIIPYDGELIIEERTDGTFEIKVGDGVHNFNDLPYISKEEIAKSDLAQALKDELDGKATKQYVDDAIAAIPTPDVGDQINTHNTSSTAHSDIRAAIGKKLDASAVTGDLLTHNASEFAKAEHDHAIADVTGLQSELDGKQAKGNYVTAVTGKGLSTNDFTTAEKEKLAGIAVGANNYTYTLPAAGTDLGGVKTGGGVTINAGVITVGEDSHIHTFATVTGLQSALDGKQAKGSYAASDHNHDSVYQAKGSYAEASHTHSTYVNQNAFSNVTVGSTTIAADTTTDTLTLVAGSNVTITPDATNDKITIAATDTVYTHPAYTSKSSGLYKVTVDATGHVSAATAVAKSDITALGIPAQDTVYTHPDSHAASMITGLAKVATTGSYNDLSNTPTIPAAVTVDSALSSTSTNPVQNKVINSALAGKAASDHNHSGVYQPVGSYSAEGHKHTKAEITDFPTSMTPTAHNQASNTINAMTGYSKPSSTSAIATSDTLNAAIGKLEKALDGKQANGSYSTTGHKHTKSEITDFPTLATVATSGSYNDLSNKPTIPTLSYNSSTKTLTIS